ncbi:MAG TPA: hypothetical protein PKM88_00930 [bacterium]|nr:hypothetical protein [bacterium]
MNLPEKCATCGAELAASLTACPRCGQPRRATAGPVPAPAVPAAAPQPSASAAVTGATATVPPPAKKGGCGLLAWLTTGIGCLMVAGIAVAVIVVIGWFVVADGDWLTLTTMGFGESPVPATPPVPTVPVPAPDAGMPLPPAVPPANAAPAPAVTGYAAYLGTWFLLEGEPGEDNTLVMRQEGNQLIGRGRDGVITFALQADGSIYGTATSDGVSVPISGQLTADKRQLVLTALFENSEPSTAIFQRSH